MASLVNGGFTTRLGFHLLNTEERERKLTPERAGRSAWAGPPRPFLTRFRPSLLHAPSLEFWIIGVDIGF
jgi:hypothetical protein